jgi:type IV secretory pathway VirB2 component (pilin)
LSEREKSTFLDRFIQSILRRTMDSIVESAQRYTKRLLRTFAMILGGIAIGLLGVAVITVGIVKWFALFMPSWLAWLVMGIFLVLIGAVLVAINR